MCVLGASSWGEQVPSLQPSLQAPLVSPLFCLTLDSVRTDGLQRGCACQLRPSAHGAVTGLAEGIESLL